MPTLFAGVPSWNWTKAYLKSDTASTYLHDPVNELTKVDNTAYEYDAAGNLTKDGTNSYYWDYENRLTKVKLVSDGSDVAEYTYDALSRRVEKIDHTGQSASTTRWYLDRWSAVEERDGDDTLQATYLNGARLDEYILMNRNSTNYWYMESAIIGNVAALVNSSGAIQEGYTYRGYGQATIHTGAGNDGVWFTSDDATASSSALSNPYLFTGRDWDSSISLQYSRARWYAPAPGRWTCRDPEVYVDGLNLYQYLTSRPILEVDPSGRWNDDTHEGRTTPWAIQARGFDPLLGFFTKLRGDLPPIVGAGDMAVDYDPSTKPTADYSWHFATHHLLGPLESPDPRVGHAQDEFALAVRYAYLRLCGSAAVHLGHALHPLQDVHAHQASHGAATPAEHVQNEFLTQPDNWGRWRADQAPTENDTKGLITSFLSLPCNPCAQPAY